MDCKHTEGFLEGAFGGIKGQSGGVGCVRVEANYEAIPDDSDISRLADELRCCVQEEAAKSINLDSPQGHITSLDSYPLLKKYLKGMTLYKDALISESWIQVAPFGRAGTQ